MSEMHAETVPFVRETMLPPAPPPIREAGAVRWLRQNLFSGPVNTILTLLGIAIIWFIVMAWDWTSLQSCQFLARFASDRRRREWGYSS